MPNSYYNHSTYPTPNSPGSSAQMRAELQLITEAFDKLPTLSGAANRLVVVNSAANALTTTTALSGLTITGSTINSSTIGASVPAGGWFTTLSATGAVSLGSSVAIAGGTINGTQIGNTTPSSGAFTTLSASSGITGNLTGNVTGALTGNVTGNLTGNVTGNVTASSGTSTFNNVTINGTLNMDAGTTGTIENLSTPVNSGDAAPKGYVDTQVATRLALAGGTMSGAIAMGTNRITGMGDPVNAQDAATKIYVDNAVQGLDAKASCRVATTANITLSGTQTIDGVSVVAGNRVLVKNQSAAAENGIYVAASGAWSRAADADTWDELVHAFVFVEQGTDGANNGYVCTVVAGGTLGTTAVTWVQFSGAGQVIAGTGLTKTGNTLNVNTASSARIVVGADEIDLATTGVAAGTYKSLTVDQWGRVTAGTNPTTLSGYGITDAYTSTQTDTLLSGKLSLTGGTMSGAIAMGTNKITGLGDPTNAQDAATKNYTDSILGSATSAAASAAAALQSEINAAASESNAAGSASNALTSANNAAASYDAFDDRYLGSKTADPTVDNDGNPLLEGALYWNSVTKIMKVYDGANWAAAYLPAAGYLPISGGTMTGAITFAGGQTFPGVLPLSGGTMTGTITFAAGQTISGYLPLTGGTVTGDTSFNGVLVGRGGSSVSTNTTAGNLALGSNTSGGNNAAFGRQALRKNTSGGNNTAVGGESLVENLTGSSNTAVGYGALYNSTASGNTAVGQQAGVALTSGENNVAIGNVALYNATTSSQNTAVGAYALAGATGEKNVGIGYFSGQAITTGAKNVVLGSFTGLGSFDIRTSNNHVVLSDGDGNVRMVFDNGGAMGLAGANYGTAGQVPKSQGAGLPPVWGSVESLGAGGASASGSVVLTASSAAMQLITPTALGQSVTLPNATTLSEGIPIFNIKNVGPYEMLLLDGAGNRVGVIGAGGYAVCSLFDNSTAAGTWQISGIQYSAVFEAFSLALARNPGSPVQYLEVDTGKHLFVFVESATDRIYGVVYDETTDTAGAATLIRALPGNPGTLPAGIAKISTTQVLVVSCATNNNSTDLQAVVLGVSGTTITVNTPTSVTLSANAARIGSPVQIGSSFVLPYARYGSTWQQAYRAMTVSGTTVTIGAEATHASSNQTNFAPVIVGISSTQFVGLGSFQSNAIQCLVGTVTGSSLSLGSNVDLACTDSVPIFHARLLSSGRISILFGNATQMRGAIISVSGSTLSASQVDLGTKSSGSAFTAVNFGDIFVAGWNDSSPANNGVRVLRDSSGTAQAGTLTTFSNSVANSGVQYIGHTASDLYLKVQNTTTSATFVRAYISGSDVAFQEIGQVAGAGVSFVGSTTPARTTANERATATLVGQVAIGAPQGGEIAMIVGGRGRPVYNEPANFSSTLEQKNLDKGWFVIDGTTTAFRRLEII